MVWTGIPQYIIRKERTAQWKQYYHSIFPPTSNSCFKSTVGPSVTNPSSTISPLLKLINQHGTPQLRLMRFKIFTHLWISLFCRIAIRTMMMTNNTDVQEAVIKPLWYSGASTCFQTISGSHAVMTLFIMFILAKTMARSSLSSVQASFAQL